VFKVWGCFFCLETEDGKKKETQNRRDAQLQNLLGNKSLGDGRKRTPRRAQDEKKTKRGRGGKK